MEGASMSEGVENIAGITLVELAARLELVMANNERLSGRVAELERTDKTDQGNASPHGVGIAPAEASGSIADVERDHPMSRRGALRALGSVAAGGVRRDL
jgi:hypothetical protein